MKIAVLLSGGVDSSVALKLLKNQGHDLTAFYLKIWLQEELSFLGDCPWEEDLDYARRVCKKVDVPLEVIPFQEEYWKEVVSYVVKELKAGRTPSPDIFCNQKIKFGAFEKYIDKSFEKIATGHYARINEKKGVFHLMRAPDPVKDQTYFLHYLTQKQLSKAFFPIGDLYKSEVRKLACKFNLPNKNRRDSQGICFLGKIRFDEFVKFHLGVKKGDIVDFETKKKLGEHDGYWFFTIGQRKGIKLPGGPWFVTKKDMKKNIIYVSHGSTELETGKDTFTVSKLNWISRKKPRKRNVLIKVRHGERMYNGKIDFITDKKIRVYLNKPDYGIASGQFAVFYDDEICLGGGMIV